MMTREDRILAEFVRRVIRSQRRAQRRAAVSSRWAATVAWLKRRRLITLVGLGTAAVVAGWPSGADAGCVYFQWFGVWQRWCW